MTVDAYLVEEYREYRYRRLMPGTSHEAYETEPAVKVDWALAFETMDAEIENRRG